MDMRLIFIVPLLFVATACNGPEPKVLNELHASTANTKVERMCAYNRMEQGFYFLITAPGQGKTGRMVNYGGAACMSSHGISTVTVKRDKQGAEICQTIIKPGTTTVLLAFANNECDWEVSPNPL